MAAPGRRLVGMILAEQDDEWQHGRRYFRPETMVAIDRLSMLAVPREAAGRVDVCTDDDKGLSPDSSHLPSVLPGTRVSRPRRLRATSTAAPASGA